MQAVGNLGRISRGETQRAQDRLQHLRRRFLAHAGHVEIVRQDSVKLRQFAKLPEVRLLHAVLPGCISCRMPRSGTCNQSGRLFNS